MLRIELQSRRRSGRNRERCSAVERRIIRRHRHQRRYTCHRVRPSRFVFHIVEVMASVEERNETFLRHRCRASAAKGIRPTRRPCCDRNVRSPTSYRHRRERCEAHRLTHVTIPRRPVDAHQDIPTRRSLHAATNLPAIAIERIEEEDQTTFARDPRKYGDHRAFVCGVGVKCLVEPIRRGQCRFDVQRDRYPVRFTRKPLCELASSHPGA